MERRGVDVGIEGSREVRHRRHRAIPPDGVVDDDGELLGRPKHFRDLRDRRTRGVVEDLRALERGPLGRTLHEVHGDRQEHRSRRLEARLHPAPLHRDRELVDVADLILVLGRGLGQLRVRPSEHGVVHEETAVLGTVHHEQRHTAQIRVAEVEHAAGQARIGVQTDHRGLTRRERVASSDADRGRFVQREHVGGTRTGQRRKERRLRRAGVAEHVLDAEGGNEVLHELGTRPCLRHRRIVTVRSSRPQCEHRGQHPGEPLARFRMRAESQAVRGLRHDLSTHPRVRADRDAGGSTWRRFPAPSRVSVSSTARRPRAVRIGTCRNPRTWRVATRTWPSRCATVCRSSPMSTALTVTVGSRH